MSAPASRMQTSLAAQGLRDLPRERDMRPQSRCGVRGARLCFARCARSCSPQLPQRRRDNRGRPPPPLGASASTRTRRSAAVNASSSLCSAPIFEQGGDLRLRLLPDECQCHMIILSRHHARRRRQARALVQPLRSAVAFRVSGKSRKEQSHRRRASESRMDVNARAIRPGPGARSFAARHRDRREIAGAAR